MLNRVEYLEFIFENCEVARIPGKYIGAFSVSNIQTEIRRIARNAVEQLDIAYEFFVEIHPDAALIGGVSSRSEMPLFKRILAYNDITSIEFALVTDDVFYGIEEKNEQNSQIYSYCLRWHGNDIYTNTRQKTCLTGDGWLYLYVGEEDVDFSDFSDSEKHKFAAVIYDIGDANYEMAKERYLKNVIKGELND